MAFSGLALRPIYENLDPFCVERRPDDSKNTLDHFFVKLFKLPQKMQTKSGREEALRRLKIMKAYLTALQFEIMPN